MKAFVGWLCIFPVSVCLCQDLGIGNSKGVVEFEFEFEFIFILQRLQIRQDASFHLAVNTEL